MEGFICGKDRMPKHGTEIVAIYKDFEMEGIIYYGTGTEYWEVDEVEAESADGFVLVEEEEDGFYCFRESLDAMMDARFPEDLDKFFWKEK